MVATDMHATIKELLKTVFPVRSVPRLYNEEQLQTAIRRVGVSCETVAGQ
jgi:hypothetical protein